MKSRRTKRSSRAKRKSRASVRKKKSTESSTRPARVAYLGLGSNIGDRRLELDGALADISRLAPLVRVSSFYSTEPVGYRAQRRFWNAVAEIRWRGSPASLLRAVKRIERRRWRIPTFAGGPRRIDLDILDLGGIVRDGPAPILPHPRLAQRRFVLAPLAEIAPAWRHPVTRLTAREMMARLPKRPGVRRVRRDW